MLKVVLMALIVLILCSTATVGAEIVSRIDRGQVATTATAKPTKALPREWVWKPRVYNFNGMYRSGR